MVFSEMLNVALECFGQEGSGLFRRVALRRTTTQFWMPRDVDNPPILELLRQNTGQVRGLGKGLRHGRSLIHWSAHPPSDRNQVELRTLRVRQWSIPDCLGARIRLVLRAYHESGHAVIASVCGALSRQSGYSVNIEPEGEFGGGTPINPLADLHTHIRVLFAGHHAEFQYFQVHHWNTATNIFGEQVDIFRQHASHDFDELEKLIYQRVGGHIDFIAYAQSDNEWTDSTIKKPEIWYAIEQLAEELYHTSVVDINDAADLIERSIREYQQRDNQETSASS